MKYIDRNITQKYKLIIQFSCCFSAHRYIFELRNLVVQRNQNVFLEISY